MAGSVRATARTDAGMNPCFNDAPESQQARDCPDVYVWPTAARRPLTVGPAKSSPPTCALVRYPRLLLTLAAHELAEAFVAHIDAYALRIAEVVDADALPWIVLASVLPGGNGVANQPRSARQQHYKQHEP